MTEILLRVAEVVGIAALCAGLVGMALAMLAVGLVDYDLVDFDRDEDEE